MLCKYAFIWAAVVCQAANAFSSVHNLLDLLRFSSDGEDFGAEKHKKHSNWAVLVAGSNGYWNYRHQADVAHAYWLLRNLGGYPSERIIVLMYDDIAQSNDNPLQGQLFNEPNGFNYYDGIQVDYSGEDVNAETFLSVLSGVPPKNVPSGKVLLSGADDNVFVYYSDHGATGLVGMPTGAPLYADDLKRTLQSMKAAGMYKNLLFYLEACESGSMFDGLLDNDTSVYATTASLPTESSYATYYNATLQTYLADEYSVSWMQDSTYKTRNGSKALTSETLIRQFSDVSKMVNQSTPQMYGDYKVDRQSIDQFEAFESHHFNGAYNQQRTRRFALSRLLGNTHGSEKPSVKGHFEDCHTLATESDDYHLELARRVAANSRYANSRDVKLMVLYNRLAAVAFGNGVFDGDYDANGGSAVTDEHMDEQITHLLAEIRAQLVHRSQVDDFFAVLVSALGVNSVQSFMELYTPPRNFACLRSAFSVYEANCEQWSEYSYKYVRTLVNACERFSSDAILTILADLCHGYPR